MPRRAARLSVVGLCLFALGCGDPPDEVCTLIGAADGLSVDVPTTVGAGVDRIRIELCQHDVCGQVEIPAAGPVTAATRAKKVMRLAVPGRVAYRVVPQTFDQHWDRSAARVDVTGVGPGGDVVLRHRETFRFEVDSPNGPDCEPHVLVHLVAVEAEDRV